MPPPGLEKKEEPGVFTNFEPHGRLWSAIYEKPDSLRNRIYLYQPGPIARPIAERICALGTPSPLSRCEGFFIFWLQRPGAIE
jgi:hypothetical protein